MVVIISTTRAALLLAVASSAVSGLAVSSAQNSTCCQSLAKALGSKVQYPNETAYVKSIASYWSAQEEAINPACVVLPLTANDVSACLKVLVPNACQFAVRSGGHGPQAGIANIQDGVTIDLSRLNSTKLTSCNQLVSVGAGQTWGGLYSSLSPYNVTVSGGRSYAIGVGGSTLGDGWGWMSNQAGFACDNVVEYEVVLADGKIITARATTNSNLWKALKGGGSNFGIVTRYVFRTIPLGKIWASNSYYQLPAENVPALISATYNFTANPKFDSKATVLASFGYNAAFGLTSYIQSVYTAPVENPSAFREFNALPGQLLNQSSLTTLPAFSAEFNAQTPDGQQQLHFAISFKNDIPTMQDLWYAYNASLAKVSAVENILWSIALQPIARFMVDVSEAQGGNMLGLSPAPPEGIIAAIFTAAFTQAADFDKVNRAADELLADYLTVTKKHGTHRDWVDLNHAGVEQDPIASYGSLNHEFLRKTAKEFDPNGVFQTLKPGGFKL